MICETEPLRVYYRTVTLVCARELGVSFAEVTPAMLASWASDPKQGVLFPGGLDEGQASWILKNPGKLIEGP